MTTLINNFGFFSKPIKNTTQTKAISITDLYEMITGQQYREVTEYLRGLPEALYKVEKGVRLDFVTVSGSFTKRNNESLKQHSNLICIDIDDVNDLERTKTTLSGDIAPVLLFTSPGGNGLKAVYHIDLNEATHTDFYFALESYFRTVLGLIIDKKCKDVARACFLCHDPEAILNLDADILGRSFIDTFSGLEKTPYITHTDHSEKMERLKTWLDKKMSFVNGNRNGYVTQLAGAFNRFGIPENETLGELLTYAEPDFTDKEIRATVRSIYSNTNYFNTAQFDENTIYDFKSTAVEADEATPLFPYEVFAKPFRFFINEYNRVYQIPPDYIAASVFFAVALAIGNKLELQTKYDNLPILWVALVGDPSTGKTNPLRTALSFFINEDKENHKRYKEDYRRWKSFEKMTKKQKDEAPEEVGEPSYFQYLLSDYTPEALYRAHEVNKRGICIYRDELKGWIDDFGRYSKSGEQSNMLSTFYRQPMAINRAGSEPMNIGDPVIMVAGGIQTDLLQSLAGDKRAESGFLARMLFVHPDDAGKKEYNVGSLSPDTLKMYRSLISAFTEIPETVVLSLSDESEKVYANWYNDNVEKTNNEPTGYLKGVYGKFDVYALRFAIILRGMNMICDFDAGTDITPDEMRGAVKLVEYFRATAIKVFDKIFSRKPDKTTSKKEVIKYLSKEEKLGQREIARILNIMPSYVNKIIKGVAVNR